MVVYSFDDIIKKAKENLRSLIPPDRIHREASDNIIDVIKRGDINVTIGPPGSGKTTTIALTLSKMYEELDEKEVIVYTTTHNSLVLEATVKTMAHLMKNKVGEDEIKESVVLFGSQFPYRRPSENAKLMFTTFYQPAPLKEVLKEKDRVHLIVDEASTARLFQVFLPISQALNSKFVETKEINTSFLSSLSIIGDPMQAILISEHKRVKPLILKIIKGAIQDPSDRRRVEEEPDLILDIAEEYLPKSGLSYYFLRKTFRLPKPSQLLISLPFYRSKLDAHRSIKEVKIERDDVSLEGFVKNTRLLKKVIDAVDNAVDSKIPVVYLKDKNPMPYSDDSFRKFDEKRATIGVELAAYLSKAFYSKRIMVVNPYREMVSQMDYQLKSKFKVDQTRVELRTVHSALGTDADIVIAVLGKEYMNVWGGGKTIYYNIPQALNVQLSRHKGLVFIIGNIEDVAKTANKLKEYSYVGRIEDAVDELVKNDSLISVEV